MGPTHVSLCVSTRGRVGSGDLTNIYLRNFLRCFNPRAGGEWFTFAHGHKKLIDNVPTCGRAGSAGHANIIADYQTHPDWHASFRGVSAGPRSRPVTPPGIRAPRVQRFRRVHRNDGRFAVQISVQEPAHEKAPTPAWCRGSPKRGWRES